MPDRPESRQIRSGTIAGMRESMKKTVTEMMVLFLLRQKQMYVYEMSQEISRLTNGVYTFNTLYLAIYRLQERGHIKEAGKRQADNRVRVYFKITKSGQEYLHDLLEEYRLLTDSLDLLLALDGTLYPEE